LISLDVLALNGKQNRIDNSEAQHNQQKHPNQLFIPAAHTQVLDQYPLPALVLQTPRYSPWEAVSSLCLLQAKMITPDSC